jgi:tRNA threonylcarbamoyladenosine biosynthesis protein TsaE
MREVFKTKTSHATRHLGEILGRELQIARPKKHAFCIALSGDLGSGKTLFTKGIAHGLGIRTTVNSPTFVLMKRYPIRGANFKNFWHIDCYRIKNQKELLVLGIADILKDPGNIVAVEWPEKIKKYIPKHGIFISFEHRSPRERALTMRA